MDKKRKVVSLFCKIKHSMLCQMIPNTQMLIILLFLSMLMAVPVFASEASQETIATFQTVIKAIHAIEHPLTGRGSAISEVYFKNHEDLSSKKILDFVFKGEQSRTTLFGIREGKREKPEVVWAEGKENAVGHNYSTNYAMIQRKPIMQFHIHHYNLNPRKFMELNIRRPLVGSLQALLDGPATLSTKSDSKGILHLVSEYQDPNTYSNRIIFVDPAKGYRLVGGFLAKERFNRTDRTYTDFFDIEWRQYESSWFVKSATYKRYAGVYSPQEESSVGRNHLMRSISIEITEFHPNIEVSDSEFTLEGFNLPPGTRIIDKISGVMYRTQ